MLTQRVNKKALNPYAVMLETLSGVVGLSGSVSEKPMDVLLQVRDLSLVGMHSILNLSLFWSERGCYTIAISAQTALFCSERDRLGPEGCQARERSRT